MNKTIHKLYRAERKDPKHPTRALFALKTARALFLAERLESEGRVRFDVVPDDHYDREDWNLDPGLFSEMEMEDQTEQWELWGKDDMLEDYHKAFIEAAPEELEDLIDYGELDPWFEKDHEKEMNESGRYPEGSGDDVRFSNRFNDPWTKGQKEVTEEELESALEWYICHVKEPRAVVVDLGSQWRVASSGLDGPPQVLPATYGEGETRLAALVNATRYFFPKD